MRILYISFSLLLISSLSFSQNNTIFAGGSYHGYSLSSYTAASSMSVNSIWAGNNYAGHNYLCYTAGNSATPNVIHTGGNAAGFNFLCYTAAGSGILNAINIGGNYAGHSTLCYAAADAALNVIFGGSALDATGGHCLTCSTPVIIPLPVTWLSFTAKPDYKKTVVNLEWATSSETNSDYYSVQRSKDAVNFSETGKVKAAGQSNTLLNYYTTDFEPLMGISYYKLIETDFDGKEKISETRVVIFNEEENSFSIYPNPTSFLQTTYLSLEAEESNEILVVIYDINGKETYSKMLISEVSGKQLIAINPENKLIPGVYFITAASENRVFHHKLVIQ